MWNHIKRSVLRVNGVEDCGELFRGALKAIQPADHLEVLQTLRRVPRGDVGSQGLVDIGDELTNFENLRLTRRKNNRRHRFQALGNALSVAAFNKR
jgi:hypothetical protein